MAGLDKKKIIGSIYLFFVISYLLFLLPALNGIDYTKMLNVLFLNFSVFESFQLSKFNPQFIIVYTGLFYIVYHMQISVISENTSYMSMVLHKKKRTNIFQTSLRESGMDNLILLLTAMISIVLVNIIDHVIYRNGSAMDMMQMMKICFFLLKYMMYVLGMVLFIRVSGILKQSNYRIMLPYALFVFLLINDYVFGSSLITMAGTLETEMKFTLVMFVFMSSILIILYIRLKISKEICND